MRALKALVAVMGILILAGTAALAVMLAERASGGGAPAPKAPAAARLDLPAGARVVETTLDGDRLALRLALPDGGVRVIVLDLRTARPLATLDLAPAAPKRD